MKETTLHAGVEHVDRMGLSVKMAPCKDCPFRKNSPRGWLGGATVEEYHRAIHGEHNIPCHTAPGWKEHDLKRMRPCAGLAISRNIVCKYPRTGQAKEAVEATENADQSNVLGWDFTSHHDRESLFQK